jgi:hypothetical protein
MIILILIIYILLYYYYIETFDEDIYNFKVSQYFKKMFDQPTIWLGYQDFDGSENYNKLFINNYNNILFKDKNI